MALRDFWVSVKTGASLLAPRADADSPRLDAEQIEAALRRADLWLTPASVTGFREADFDFLDAAERGRLARLVADFRAVALRVPQRGPVPDDLREEALPLFRDIVALLEFDRFADADAFRVGKQVERALAEKRPAELADLRFRTGDDSTGDLSVCVYATLTDSAATGEECFTHTRAIRELLTDAIHEVAPELWPYVTFRTVSEQEELASGVRR